MDVDISFEGIKLNNRKHSSRDYGEKSVKAAKQSVPQDFALSNHKNNVMYRDQEPRRRLRRWWDKNWR